MFEYDSRNDEYNEIFSFPNNTEDTVQRKNSVSVISIKSSKSSKLSVRSDASISKRSTRLVSRSGRLNVFQIKISQKRIIYFRDLGNTLLNIRWRWIILALILVNFLSFYIFGMLFMWIAYISGDFEVNAKNLCIVNVNTTNLTGYILLSIETMLTIGYGYRYPTENCVHGWIVPFLQALVSIGIQGVLVSAVYVKITKPLKNSHGIFSKKAVICLRDGKMCLIFRIADVAGKISAGTSISMYFIDKENIQDAAMNFTIKQIKIEPYGFLIYPVDIIHVIDSESPFWRTTPIELLTKSFEIVVIAEGLSVITSQPSQNRTSYINSDILWGHRFSPCVSFNHERGKYVINYKDINKVVAFDTPLCSAQMLNTLEKYEFNVSNVE